MVGREADDLAAPDARLALERPGVGHRAANGTKATQPGARPTTRSPSPSAATIEQERHSPVASRWVRATSSWRAVRGATNG